VQDNFTYIQMIIYLLRTILKSEHTANIQQTYRTDIKRRKFLEHNTMLNISHGYIRELDR